MKQATLPVIMAVMTPDDNSVFLLGAMADSPPRTIPIEPMFEKPQSAYVAMAIERSYRFTHRYFNNYATGNKQTVIGVLVLL